MDAELAMVLGVVMVGFSIPSILSALADRRSPRVASVIVVVGGGLILYAIRTMPGGFEWQDIPASFVQVVAWILN